jgi:hypothetical protein
VRIAHSLVERPERGRFQPLGCTLCEALDVDGDKRLAYFSLGSDGKVTRTFVVGTGKYEGMITTGTVEPLGPFPVIKDGTFQDCNHQIGTYKLM